MTDVIARIPGLKAQVNELVGTYPSVAAEYGLSVGQDEPRINDAVALSKLGPSRNFVPRNSENLGSLNVSDLPPESKKSGKASASSAAAPRL